MKLYMAPMEGLTGYIYRQAFCRYFGGADKVFTPFIAAEGSRSMKNKEIKDIAPENNKGLYTVPQIISNNADNFVRFARLIEDRGYEEININLGCPSGTVVSKGKGSGMLGDTDKLDSFLDKVYGALPDMKVSVKTRIGLKDPEECMKILKVYNRYPIHELIVHPRIREDVYKGSPRMEYFSYIYENSLNPVCYNGDIKNVADYEEITEKYHMLQAVMIGRGLIRNPAILKSIGSHESGPEYVVDKQTLRMFHDDIYNAYKSYLEQEKIILFKMKEIWCFMIDLFADNEKYFKMLKKSDNLRSYNIFVNKIFYEADLNP